MFAGSAKPLPERTYLILLNRSFPSRPLVGLCKGQLYYKGPSRTTLELVHVTVGISLL